jgi:hypothetical protein
LTSADVRSYAVSVVAVRGFGLMGGVISDGTTDWFVAGYEFRQVLGRAREKVARADDRWRLEQAEALQGLHFDLMQEEQAKRLAAAVGQAAEDLHAEISAGEPRDAREAGFRDLLSGLGELVARVRDGHRV